MLTLDELKTLLHEEAMSPHPNAVRGLTDKQYSDGFNIIRNGPGSDIYNGFVTPQLSRILSHLLESRLDLTCCEIGPGPQTILELLAPEIRQRISRYDALEPNKLFEIALRSRLFPLAKARSTFQNLQSEPIIHPEKFSIGVDAKVEVSPEPARYDVVLLCHSLYGMNPKYEYLKRTLDILTGDGVIIVFHRGTSLDLGDLVCQDNSFSPTGIIHVKDDDRSLNTFCAFISGFTFLDEHKQAKINADWRSTCRSSGARGYEYPGHLAFSCPSLMVQLAHNSFKLSDLTKKVPLATNDKRIKNPGARLHSPAAIVRPSTYHQVQECVKWALKNNVRLAVIGGSHSGHCQWSNVVSLDMEAFGTIKVIKSGVLDIDPLIIAGTGCKSGHIVKKAMEEGLTVPLGSRPSVGAGLWLQGGIGHLSRQYGLTSDAILGAVLVDVKSGRLLYVGNVPIDHRPAGAVRPEHESDLLWGIRGAGTNLGIVLSVVFRAFPALVHSVRHWELPIPTTSEICISLGQLYEKLASKAPREESVDVYLYSHNHERRLAWTNIKSSTTSLAFAKPVPSNDNDTSENHMLTSSIVDVAGLLDSEFHMSGMSGERGPGKTSSFKRCVFLNIGLEDVRYQLAKATESLPSELCYFHLLHGGGAIRDVAESATAFGCRNWEYACVITGVWRREEDNTPISRKVTEWVYGVVEALLPQSNGVYSADLGPDPRDTGLAGRAFGPNNARLARLKDSLDPYHTLRYACPLPIMPSRPKIIVLVSGETCAGKDYCAKVWAQMINERVPKRHTALVVSISDRVKREYADTTSECDFDRLLKDRAYKEKHRGALTLFWKSQVQRNPKLAEQHFQDLVAGSGDVDLLFVTGIRDDTPVATLSHLAPECRMLEIHVRSEDKTRSSRSNGEDKLGTKPMKHTPCLIFENNAQGDRMVRLFATDNIYTYLHEDLQRLSDMVMTLSGWPRPDTDFRHILGIAEKPQGLSLCTSLLQSVFSGNWSHVDAIVSCEAGGFIFAAPLALQVKKPLVVIRKAGKLPPPTTFVTTPLSYIAEVGTEAQESKQLEISCVALPNNASVVVVDDVLSTGRTLCAVLELLGKAGVCGDKIYALNVAEFPYHRGREFLVKNGYAKCVVQSVLVYGGK